MRDGLPVLEGGEVLTPANVVWCTGFHPGLSWLDLPVFGPAGEPVQQRGVATGEPGLYFVGLHFLMSHPLRAPLVRAVGEGPFRGIYSLVAVITFGGMIYYYRAIGREPPLWEVGEAQWIVATLLMWLGSILFVGSFVGNPALPGARGPSGPPRGVFAITRHPMMWGFALWAIVHLAVVAMPKALVFDGAIIP